MSGFKAKCTKFDFGWGSAPDPAGGAYSAPPDPIAGFKGAASRQGGEGKGRGMGRDGKTRVGMVEKGKGWRREGEGEGGNVRDRTGHGMGEGKGKSGKGGERLQPQTLIPGAATPTCKSSND